MGKIGPELDYAIFANKEDITKKELDQLVDELVELAEKRRWSMGGDIRFIDENGMLLLCHRGCFNPLTEVQSIVTLFTDCPRIYRPDFNPLTEVQSIVTTHLGG